MSYYVSGGSGEYQVPDEGLHDGVLCDVIDLGVQDTGFGPKSMVKLRWQLDILNEKTGKRHLVSQRYTSSIHPKAKLGQHLETWRGRKFSDQERQRFDIEKLLGVNALLQIVHSLGRQGGTFANVNAVLPPSKNPTTKKPWWDRLTVVEYVREKDRPKDQRVSPPVVAGSRQDDPFTSSEEPSDKTYDEPDDDDDVPF